MKKIFSWMLVAAMFMTLLTGCSSEKQESESQNQSVEQTENTEYEYVFRELPEANYIEPSEAFAGGAGTESDPYQISNAEELAYMGEILGDSDKQMEYSNAYYELTADIVLNDTSDFDNWTKTSPEYSWKPIDCLTFKGVFDGAGYKISGMYINTNCGDEENFVEEAYGVFGQINGTVKNLVVEKSYIAVSGYTAEVGGIVGNLSSEGKIENCVSSVNIDCYDAACGGVAGKISGGMLVGYDYAEDEEVTYSQITDCTFEGVINQKKDSSLSYIGGLAGAGDGYIVNCTNNGTINFGADNVDSVGGIIAFWGDGKITDCQNSGTLNGSFSDDAALARVGGIVGNMFLSNTGSEEYMSRGAIVENCQNSGVVSGHFAAGGIVGHAINDNNDWCLSIVNCTNSGEVKAAEYTGGIVGRLVCNGDDVNGNNIEITNCVNTADLEQGTVGGIIGYFETNSGKVEISECKNDGSISTIEQNCGGIVAYWLMGSKPEVETVIDGCENNGEVHSPNNAGGIFGYVDAPVLLEDVKDSTIAVKNCMNNGNVITDSDNSYIGGIAGCWGMNSIPAVIEKCTNSGNLIIKNSEPDSETLNSEKVFSISRIAGGIIGRLGEGLLLTTDSDKASSDNIQKENAVLTITECENTGNLEAAVEEEFKNSDGEQIYVNYFGGIIGNTCAEEGFSVNVENCTYSNFERGLGNVDQTDIGSKR